MDIQRESDRLEERQQETSSREEKNKEGMNTDSDKGRRRGAHRERENMCGE